jgi:mannose/fructose-specific phosphotransferase system component IIA
MVRGIIIGHGDFAKAMVHTAEHIVGEQTGLVILSNRGCSCDSLAGHITEIVDKGDIDNMIIFLDLPGGSCTISCYTILKDYPDLKIISGINLPMLIEFFMLRDQYSAVDLVPILLKKGRDNMIQLRSKQ